MPSAHPREDLQPPADPGLLRSYALALLVHLLLAVALTWGVSWKSQDPEASFSAELWSATPQEAAPPLAEPPPEPPAATPPPPPAPPQPSAAALAAAAQAEAEADIALQRERQRKRQQEEAAKEAAKAKAVALAAAEKAEKEKAEKEKARKAQEVAQAKAKAAKDTRPDPKQEAKEQAAAEKLRQQNIARMMGMAGGTGAPEAKGTAAQASGPSDGYAGRVRARIKPNVVFTDDLAGNPVAEVEVRTSIDGTIISQRLIKSSGNRAWDDAVIKAIIRTEVLPRDIDGRVPTPLIISFRPKD